MPRGWHLVLMLSSTLGVCGRVAAESAATAEAPMAESHPVEEVESAEIEPSGEADQVEATREAPPEAPQGDPYAEAKERVARAEALFDEGNFDAALTEFWRAYETMEGHPRRYFVLYNIARCFESLHLYDDAINAYRRYLSEGGEGADDAAVVKARVQVLEELLGRVTLTVVSGTGERVQDYEVWVDGRRLGQNQSSFLLPGGNHEIEVRARGFSVEKQPLRLTATGKQALRFELEPLAEEYKGIRPTLFWVSTGLAAATLLAGGTLGVLALNERSKVDDQLAKDPPDSLEVDEADRRRIRTLANTADVFFVASGVFTASAVLLAFLTDFEAKPETGPHLQARLPLQLGVTRGGVMLSVPGVF